MRESTSSSLGSLSNGGRRRLIPGARISHAASTLSVRACVCTSRTWMNSFL